MKERNRANVGGPSARRPRSLEVGPGRVGLLVLLALSVASCEGAPPDEPRPAEPTELRAADDRAAFEAACRDGDATACYRLGLIYAGDSVAAARDRGAGDTEVGRFWGLAAERFDEACRDGEGFARACTVLADLSMAGLGTRQDEGRAVALYRAACERGHADACNHLGDAHSYGIAVDEDEEVALELFLEGCRADSPSYTACFRAAARIQSEARAVEGEDTPLLPEVRELYERSCSEGSPMACLNLAFESEQTLTRRLENNPGLLRDPDFIRARDDSVVAVYREVCDRGVPLGCNNLGALLVSGGLGLDVDRNASRELYGHACREGRLELACNNLGWVLVADGDTASAMDYFMEGCTLADGGSCADHSFFAGQRDPDGGMVQALIGCALGNGAACNNAGWAYERGGGLTVQAAAGRSPPRADLALHFYRQACEMENGMGCRNVSRTYGNQGETRLQERYRERACRLDDSLDICGD